MWPDNGGQDHKHRICLLIYCSLTLYCCRTAVKPHNTLRDPQNEMGNPIHHTEPALWVFQACFVFKGLLKDCQRSDVLKIYLVSDRNITSSSWWRIQPSISQTPGCDWCRLWCGRGLATGRPFLNIISKIWNCLCSLHCCCFWTLWMPTALEGRPSASCNFEWWAHKPVQAGTTHET